MECVCYPFLACSFTQTSKVLVAYNLFSLSFSTFVRRDVENLIFDAGVKDNFLEVQQTEDEFYSSHEQNKTFFFFSFQKKKKIHGPFGKCHVLSA